MKANEKEIKYFIVFMLFFQTIFVQLERCEAASGPLEQMKLYVDQIVEILRNDDPAVMWVEKKEKIVTLGPLSRL